LNAFKLRVRRRLGNRFPEDFNTECAIALMVRYF
jgi:hypothetical protein